MWRTAPWPRRAGQVLRRLQPVLLAGVFVLGVCALELNRNHDPLSAPRANGKPSFRSEFELLQKNTNKLYKRIDVLAESLSGIARELNAETSSADTLRDTLEAVRGRAKDEAAGLKDYIKQTVGDVKGVQETELAELQEKIAKMPKCANALPATPALPQPREQQQQQQQQQQGVSLQDFNRARTQGAQPSAAGEPQGARIPVPDPCAHAAHGSSDDSAEDESSSGAASADELTTCRCAPGQEGFPARVAGLQAGCVGPR